MKTVRFAVFLFYRYYKSGKWESVPYFHALSSMSLLLFLNAGAVLCFLNRRNLLFGTNKNLFIVKFLALYFVSMILFWRIAPEKKLRNDDYTDKQISLGKRLLIGYFVLSMALLFLGITTDAKR